MEAQFDADQYDANYFDGYYLKDVNRDLMYLQERNRIMKYYPQGGRILDIGCGVGGFLNTFDDRWERHGIDPAEYAADKAHKKGIQLWRSLQVLETETFDVVVFRGTLQHIAFPFQAIGHAARVLRKGGLLVFLATPDADGIVYKIWGRLPALDAPKNWMIIGTRSLTNIMQRLGFKVSIIHPYLETPYANPVMDFSKFVISLFFGWRKFAFPHNMFEMYCIKE